MIVILIAVGALVLGWYLTLRKGVFAGNQFFYRVSDSKYTHDKSNYIERISEGEFRIMSASGEKTVSIRPEGDAYEVSFPDKVSYTGYWMQDEFVDSSGIRIGVIDFDDLYANTESSEIRDADYCQAIGKIYFGKSETISAWYIQALGIICYILGIIVILLPNETYFFLTKWRYRNPELSETGIVFQKAGGVVLSALGVAIMSGVIGLIVSHAQ